MWLLPIWSQFSIFQNFCTNINNISLLIYYVIKPETFRDRVYLTTVLIYNQHLPISRQSYNRSWTETIRTK